MYILIELVLTTYNIVFHLLIYLINTGSVFFNIFIYIHNIYIYRYIYIYIYYYILPQYDIVYVHNLYNMCIYIYSIYSDRTDQFQ